MPPLEEPLRRTCHLIRDCDRPKPPWSDQPCHCPPNFGQTTQQAINVFLLSQGPKGGMSGLGWWQTANGYTAIALHDLWSGTKHNYANLDAAIRKCEARQRGLINVFNDDTLWWGMLCIYMYELGGDDWYIDLAKGIWRHVRDKGRVDCKGKCSFRGEDMEGAVWWTTKPHEVQLSAISAGLFAELGARLALISKQQPQQPKHHHLRDLLGSHHSSEPEDYLTPTLSALHWILTHRFRPRKGLVLDHIKIPNPSAPNGPAEPKAVDWTFTYTTGTLLGTLALLYRLTGEKDYMELACHVAHRAMTHTGWVESSGVLTEKSAYGREKQDPMKDNDSVGFKAVLIRHLGVLHNVIEKTGCASEMPVARETKEMVAQFLRVNVRAQVERNCNNRGQFGPWWDGPFECPTSHSQMAALDVLAAGRLVER